jgi:hypothetical protein
LLAIAAVATPTPAFAGPPYLTDDPVPADAGHWEAFAFAEGEGRHSDFDGDVGLDINYGLVKDVQITATIPLSFSHESLEGWSSGSVDLEFGVKYEFLHDKGRGISASVFPSVTLPTARDAREGKKSFFLPLWAQKDFAGGTGIFGGGGYTINPGTGNRDFWQGGIAVTQDVSEKFSVGVEIIRQGSDTRGGTGQTRAGVGTVLQLTGHHSLLISGGPTWADHKTSYHAYAAIGFSY